MLCHMWVASHPIDCCATYIVAIVFLFSKTRALQRGVSIHKAPLLTWSLFLTRSGLITFGSCTTPTHLRDLGLCCCVVPDGMMHVAWSSSAACLLLCVIVAFGVNTLFKGNRNVAHKWLHFRSNAMLAQCSAQKVGNHGACSLLSVHKSYYQICFMFVMHERRCLEDCFEAGKQTPVQAVWG